MRHSPGRHVGTPDMTSLSVCQSPGGAPATVHVKLSVTACGDNNKGATTVTMVGIVCVNAGFVPV